MHFLNFAQVIYLIIIDMPYFRMNVLLLLTLLLFSCTENVALKQEDVMKIDWLKPFIMGVASDFDGTHDIDNGALTFSYKTTQTNDIISALDEVSLLEEWKVDKMNDLTRVYTKNILMYGDTFKTTTIYVIYDSDSRIIKFKVNNQ